MVQRGCAAYEPSKQTSSVLLYWRLPEEWADVLHRWVCIAFFQNDGWNVELLSGDRHWPAKHDHDLLRDHRPSDCFTPLRHTRFSAKEGDIDLVQERKGPDNQHS